VGGDKFTNFPLKYQGEHYKPEISAIAVNPKNPKLLALGCFDSSLFLVNGDNLQVGRAFHRYFEKGITCLKYSECGFYCYVGCRKDNGIYCFDVRKTASEAIHMVYQREGNTNQRMYFDAKGGLLVSGQSDGSVIGYRGEDPAFYFMGHFDSVGTVSLSEDGETMVTGSG